jgi:hypothetical protein
MRRIAARAGSSLLVAVAASLASLVGIVIAALLGQGAIAMLEAVLCGWSMARVARLFSLQPLRDRQMVGRAVGSEAKTPVG